MSHRSLLFGAAALSVMAGAAQAQPASPVNTVDELVVTAAPFAVAEDQLTSNVDVITREELDLAAPAGLGDILAGLPGVRSTAFAPGASRPVVRGLAGPRVQVLTNGVGLIDASGLSPDHQVAVDPMEARRIEVIRGPAALAYGGSAIGGVVNIIDERVPETPAVGGVDGRVTVSGSTVGSGFNAGAEAKIGEGPWVVSLDAIRRESNDYDIPGGRISQRLADALGEPRDSEQSIPNSAVELTEYGAGVAYVTGLGFLGGSVKRTDTTYGTVAEEEVTIDLEQTRYDLRGEIDYGFGPFQTVKLAAGYADYTHTEFEGAEVGTVFANEGAEGRLELVQRERDGWNGAVGLQALTRDFDAVGEEAYVRATTIEELGAFTLQRVDRDRFGFEGGMRVDGRTLDNADFGERDYTNVSASGGVFVRPAEGLFLGLSAGRTERAPDEAELFADGVHVATGQAEIGAAARGLDFDSEVALSLEGTLHVERGGFDADVHVFAVKYDGFIDLRPTGAFTGGEEGEDAFPIFNYVQTDADFHGFELEAGHDLWRRDGRAVRVEGAADYVRADTDLGAPPRIPPWSVTGRLIYDSAPVDARLEVRRVGEQDRTAAFELPTDGYTLVNALLAFSPTGPEGVTVFLEGRNLTDEEAREHASFLKDIAPLPGRNFRAGLAVRF